MSLLTFLHRWLGVVFCLFFAMWFASGVVMHFVHYPSLTEAERLAGLTTVDPTLIRHGPLAAIRASGLAGVSRVRLFARADGPVYVVQGSSGLVALRASDLSSAHVTDAAQALALAVGHAKQRGLATENARAIDAIDVDQWTVVGGAEKHRPVHRIALHDEADTVLYVSSTTGEILRDTTAWERGWNWLGTVPHLIYPTVLRRDYATWDTSVWALSLAALVTALLGAALGLLRLRKAARLADMTPYRGWHAWHHGLGVACMAFILSWVFSGWLSMDHGRMFSTGKLDDKEAALFATRLDPAQLRDDELMMLTAPVREVEWFSFGGRSYRRERVDLEQQRIAPVGARSEATQRFFRIEVIDELAKRLGDGCTTQELAGKDVYTATQAVPGSPVFRIVCGDVWYQISGATGAMQGKLDPSRRTARWIFGSLHSLEFLFFIAHPLARTATLLLLCGLGFAFSLTGVMIAWRRVSRSRT